jgi:predicted membrane channel-forming protein YqfA (hemolysin III family)
MKGLPSITTILVGFFLLLLGAVLAWLLVLRIIPSTFLLNFLSYTASVAGLFMGLVGVVLYVRLNRNKRP